MSLVSALLYPQSAHFFRSLDCCNIGVGPFNSKEKRGKETSADANQGVGGLTHLRLFERQPQ